MNKLKYFVFLSVSFLCMNSCNSDDQIVRGQLVDSHGSPVDNELYWFRKVPKTKIQNIFTDTVSVVQIEFLPVKTSATTSCFDNSRVNASFDILLRTIVNTHGKSDHTNYAILDTVIFIKNCLTQNELKIFEDVKNKMKSNEQKNNFFVVAELDFEQKPFTHTIKKVFMREIGTKNNAPQIIWEPLK